jgi:hypothetical protein
MKLYEISGTYGSSKTPCTVFVAEKGVGSWYCVEGSQNVNFVYQNELPNGVDVEELEDLDFFYYSKPINSLEELENAINS